MGLLLAFLTPPSVSYATHIVGGDMTYRFIEQQGENNLYRVRLNIYYDCFPADGQAANDSDSTIMIAVYQRMTASPELWRLVGNNGSARMLTVRRSPMTTIPNPTYECLIPPTDKCVQHGVFEFDLILKRIAAPYVISYQRCCRNGGIGNLAQLNAGANYYAEISPEAQAAGNSSPTFSNYPPPLLCVNTPFTYNHVATDADGDRLVYRFVKAMDSPGEIGRTGCYQAPNSGNYNCPPEILKLMNKWEQNYRPSYSHTSPLGTNVTFTIDSVTGFMQGLPRNIGRFVVSVAVEEWRGNVLLGRTFRDFQFNIVYCPKKAEVIFDYRADSSNYVGDKRFIIQKCDSLAFRILHTSKTRDSIGANFYWEFNIGGTTQRFNDWFPQITVPDTGYYQGMLWLNRGNICYDSAYVDIQVGAGVTPNFSINFDSCAATPVTFRNTSSASRFGIKDITWNLSDTSFIEYYPSVSDSVSRFYNTVGLKTVSLKIKNRFGCSTQKVKTFIYQPSLASVRIAASETSVCIPSTVSFRNLTLPTDTSLRIKWDFGDGTVSTLNDPTHSYTRAGNFAVKMTATNLAGCEKSAFLAGGISASNKPKADFDFNPKIVGVQNGIVNFTNQSSADATQFRWLLGQNGIATLPNPRYNFQDTGSQKIQLIVRNTFGCSDTTSKILLVEPFYTYFLPNTFTPNSDGLNEGFVGKGETAFLRDFSMQIFDRWGGVIFETTNPETAWNGRKNNTGADLPEGVYLCIVKYRTYAGNFKEIKEYIKLNR